VCTGTVSSKFVIKWLWKIPPHLKHAVTIPCDNLLSAR